MFIAFSYPAGRVILARRVFTTYKGRYMHHKYLNLVLDIDYKNLHRVTVLRFQIGKQQHYALGKYFRVRYNNFLNSSYSPYEIYVQASDVDRLVY